MGAWVVVGTLTRAGPAHGSSRRGAPLDAMRTMASAADVPPQGVNFGEALRSIRRRLLAQGIIIALCLTAYGDANWMIPPMR